MYPERRGGRREEEEEKATKEQQGNKNKRVDPKKEDGERGYLDQGVYYTEKRVAVGR